MKPYNVRNYAVLLLMGVWMLGKPSDALSEPLKPEEPLYQYRFGLVQAVREADAAHSVIMFTLKLSPKNAQDRRLLAENAQDPLALIQLNQLVFTLYDGTAVALEPAAIYPWQHTKRIRFFLVKADSTALSIKNHEPTIVVKLMYPNYVVTKAPAIKIEDIDRDVSATIHVKQP